MVRQQRIAAQMKPLAVDLYCGVAYIVTCAVDGKRYIGITKRGISRRWREHLSDAKSGKMTPLRRAIRAYGVGQFAIQEVLCAASVKDLCHCEKILIAQHETIFPSGLNGDAGGNEFSYQKSAEAIERSAAKHRGKPLNKSHRESIGKAQRGRPKPIGMGQKVSAALTGRTRTEATRRKLSEGRKGKPFNVGELNGGAKLSADQVREARIRLAAGETTGSIGRSFGVGYKLIWRIAAGKKWKSVA